MEKIFFAKNPAFPSSISAVKEILSTYFGIDNAEICRTENGKPYLKNAKNPLHFSISHTKTGLFIAFSKENVGIDAERMERTVRYQSILNKFPFEEREEIACEEDFLRHWTVKESAIKWLGGTLAHDLKKLRYTNGLLHYNQLELPVHITTLRLEGHILSICSDRDFSSAEFITL